MARQWPQCRQGGGGAGDPPTVALPLGPDGAAASQFALWPKRLRSMEELEAEIRRLRAENTKLLEQREVLKKSLGILSEVPPSGMPESRR
jgi:hypothetical protein